MISVILLRMSPAKLLGTRTRSRFVAGALAAAFALAAFAPAALAHPVGQTWVPYPQVLAQVRTGPLIRAIINPARMDVEIKFRNLDEWHAYYPRGAQQQIQRLLHARHVHVIFVPRPQAATASTGTSGHPLRWGLAGAALLALAAGGLAVLLRRRRGSG